MGMLTFTVYFICTITMQQPNLESLPEDGLYLVEQWYPYLTLVPPYGYYPAELFHPLYDTLRNHMVPIVGQWFSCPSGGFGHGPIGGRSLMRGRGLHLIDVQ